MAGLDSSEVRVAVTGAVMSGLTSLTAPTTASSTWTGGVDLGYVSEDGVTETIDRTTDKLKAWQDAATVRTLITDSSATYHFTLLQTNADVLSFYYGVTVDDTDGSILISPGAVRPRVSMVIDIVDGDEFIRVYLPEAELTELGDQVYVNGAAIGYECTVEAYPVTVGDDTYSIKKFYSSLVDAG